MVLRRKHSPSDKHYLYRLKDKEVLDYLSLMPAMEWCPYHYRGLECKCRKSRKPGITGKFGLGIRNEAGQKLIEFCQENALVITKPSSNNTREDSIHGHHQMVNTEIKLIIFFAAKDGEAVYSQQRPGADCGSDYELLISKFRLKLKKVGKTTRPFRYDLNQIPYDYTVEVRNRVKGLDLIDRVPDELWNEVRDIVQETGIKIPGKEMQKSKMAVWGGLTNSCEKKRSEKQRRKGKI